MESACGGWQLPSEIAIARFVPSGDEESRQTAAALGALLDAEIGLVGAVKGELALEEVLGVPLGKGARRYA